jgi:hypothetical protein
MMDDAISAVDEDQVKLRQGWKYQTPRIVDAQIVAANCFKLEGAKRFIGGEGFNCSVVIS